jgi:hypothetical protein
MILYVNYLYIAGLAGAQGRPARWAPKSSNPYEGHAPNTSAPGAGRGARGAKKECLPWITDTESYRDLQESYRTTLLPNLKSVCFGSCPDLIIKERTAAALACSNNSVPI